MPLVFITGGGRRIGRGLSINFAKKGWDVAINYNKSKKEAEETKKSCESYGINAIILQGDVSVKSEIIECIDQCKLKLGVPDVLINNAGIFPKKTELSDISEELIKHTLEVNLLGEFFSSQHFAKIAKPGSRIINIGSLGAFQVWEGRIPYHLSKAGVVKLTKNLARELAPDISVNCVCPGTIIIPGEPAADGTTNKEESIPMKRYGNIDDIFDAVYFFATASNYITAQILHVDGGYNNAR